MQLYFYVFALQGSLLFGVSRKLDFVLDAKGSLNVLNVAAANRTAKNDKEHDGHRPRGLLDHIVNLVEPLDDAGPCRPPGCRYQNKSIRLGEGKFAFAKVVKNTTSGRNLVWKRFKKDVPLEDHEYFIANAERIFTWKCPHTTMVWDPNPKIIFQHGRRVIDENGYVSEIMAGNVETYLETLCRSTECVCKCGRKFMLEILTALNCLRSQGFVHTDVKLDNILYIFESSSDDCPVFKLADFDLLTEVGATPYMMTPPLVDLSEEKSTMDLFGEYLYVEFGALAGYEDFAMLALSYFNFFDQQKFSTPKQLKDFVKFMRREGSLPLQEGLLGVPQLGCFHDGPGEGQTAEPEVEETAGPTALDKAEPALNQATKPRRILGIPMTLRLPRRVRSEQAT